MTLARYAKKRDTVEAAIVEALRGFGARVWRLDRPFDILVGFHGQFTVLEVKTGKKPLTTEQADEVARCRAGGLPVHVVRTVDEALSAIEATYGV